MKILHSADIHLKEYGDERWRALERLIETGKNEKIEIFVISGDLFDKDIDQEYLRPGIRGIFSNTGFKIVLLPGNHDSNSYKKGMYFGDDAVVITDLSVPFEYKNIHIWGMPFEPIEGIKIVRKLHSLAGRLSADKFNILLYHGELTDAYFSRRDFGDEGEERYMPVKLSYFNDIKIDYVLAGHFHTRFDIKRLNSGGYFVYPGSPVSITRKETGQRQVNIFKTGEPPRSYPIDTSHFEELIIEFDPFDTLNPMDKINRVYDSLHTDAKVILNVKGFTNCKAIGMREEDIVQKIKSVFKGRCIEENYEFKDIYNILEDDLFKAFLRRLGDAALDFREKKRMTDMTIKAFMGLRL